MLKGSSTANCVFLMTPLLVVDCLVVRTAYGFATHNAESKSGEGK